MTKTHLKYFFVAALVFVIFYEIYSHQIIFIELLNKLQKLPEPEMFVYFCLLYIISNLFLLPLGLPLNLFAGLVWGTFSGGLLINLLATFVAAVSFILARTFEHRFLDVFLKKKPNLLKFKDTINKYDWQFISMARINPLVPFSLSNYMFGLIPELSFKHYIIATVLANLLPCFVFASIGSVIKTFSLANNQQIHYLILAIGILLLLISGMLLFKMILSNQQQNYSLKKEVV
jgi:uncharacterized membrane protein YdjX (TVP38/TMEM64 family)